MQRNFVRAVACMLLAVLAFNAGDFLTRETIGHVSSTTRHFPTTQALFYRIAIGLILLSAYGWIFHKPVSFHALLDRHVVLRSLVYSVTIFCFAQSFSYGSDMTAVYVISYLWPLLAIG